MIISSSSREDQVDAGEVTEVIEVDRVTDMVRDEVEDITIGEVTEETGAETVVETEAGTVMVTEVETDMTRLLVTVMDLRGEVDVVDLEVVDTEVDHQEDAEVAVVDQEEATEVVSRINNTSLHLLNTDLLSSYLVKPHEQPHNTSYIQ